ncbi:TetR/AcrR family transcriptional regulator C-terminal domain-containing protein [Paractinoplanes ferrugineus]|uniref:TetR family transcriptional regulator n=1 Tax=Paractinoplanes ferrugineus TaxID=113564 RepID=A0A919J0D8_9ACTN|nr:TetR/AcrR family transcriptional regulator C-terminal domain-containing protein [Actinoplanes ferrugineus]GIE11077.1 TetR family transcriptional regulator [Actinoplanes ferrugineus]
MADASEHVRRLWRHRGTTVPAPRRGPRQQLDLDEILDVAAGLADAAGLAAVSTRAVAARFDKTAMALYPYVGTKEQFLALLQDHVSPLPSWPDPATSAADDLVAWALAFFRLHLAHPWLTELSWARSGPGPNERDWMERLLGILDRWAVPPARRTPAVTMLYATVRACAETAAGYARLDRDGAAAWLDRAAATRELIPDLSERYPRTAGLAPITPQWRDAPRAGLVAATELLAGAMSPPQSS